MKLAGWLGLALVAGLALRAEIRLSRVQASLESISRSLERELPTTTEFSFSALGGDVVVRIPRHAEELNYGGRCLAESVEVLRNFQQAEDQ